MQSSEAPVKFPERVIVVDDQPDVLKTMLQLLRHLGRGQSNVEFLATTEAVEALWMVENNPATWLITDLDLSHHEIDGLTLARAAHLSAVLLVSGNLGGNQVAIDRLLAERGDSRPPLLTLAKPFTMSELRHALQTLTQ